MMDYSILINIFFFVFFNSFKSLVLTFPQKWSSNQLCIQDIFEHKNNVTFSAKPDDIKSFKHFCAKALNALQANGATVKY